MGISSQVELEPAESPLENRFAFGANWARFLARLTPERISLAERSLTDWLGELRGRTFLDIGSGSGLFSLAARNLGARVHSFDYDPQSVACTEELRRRYHRGDTGWTVERGSALDEPYVRALGTFDVVYSWGVLHHTGQMWRALELAALPVADGGRLFIAIYNRMRPLRHRAIVAMKWTYVHTPAPVRSSLVGAYAATHGLLEIGSAVYRRRPLLGYFRRYAETSRGMSWWTDIVDWVGGYPYEAATPPEIARFYAARGLTLERERPAIGHGCNEFLLRRAD
jgi:2-polyprenyl-3-methyl-5-hydroxy-6-metoxy-1,4-benzoquinol methylase